MLLGVAAFEISRGVGGFSMLGDVTGDGSFGAAPHTELRVSASRVLPLLMESIERPDELSARSRSRIGLLASGMFGIISLALPFSSTVCAL